MLARSLPARQDDSWVIALVRSGRSNELHSSVTMFVPEGPTLDYSSLLRAWLRPRPFRIDFGRQSYLFGYARDALLEGLRRLHLQSHEHVLVPAFLCDAVLQPFDALGIPVRYYGVTADLQPDLEDVERRVTPETRALLHIHFFGMPSSIERVVELCERRRLCLIEDCAHASFGALGDRPFGTFGHFSIFSFRKFAGIGDGAALVINHSSLQMDSAPEAQPAPVPRTALELCELAAKRVLRGLPRAAVALRAVWQATGIAAAGDRRVRPVTRAAAPISRHISGPARRMLGVMDVAAAAERRRANFLVWLDLVCAIPGVKGVYTELPAGVVPYHFPVRVRERAVLRGRLAKRGIFLEPTFNQSPIRTRGIVLNRDESFPVVEQLSAELLSLPVYQELTPATIDRVATELTRAGRVVHANP